MGYTDRDGVFDLYGLINERQSLDATFRLLVLHNCDNRNKA